MGRSNRRAISSGLWPCTTIGWTRFHTIMFRPLIPSCFVNFLYGFGSSHWYVVGALISDVLRFHSTGSPLGPQYGPPGSHVRLPPESMRAVRLREGCCPPQAHRG